MPELPDVRVFKDYFDRSALHRRVRRAHVETAKILGGVTKAELERSLPGRTLHSSHAHGKLLFIELQPREALLLHFGMTGFLVHVRNDEEALGHPRVTLELEDGDRLVYDCQRLFGRVDLVPDVEQAVRELRLGPDALLITREAFIEAIRARHGAIKKVLMNQEVVAGIGNIYSDEILFHQRIHPETPTQSLDEAALGRLHGAARHVLRRAIEARVDVQRMPRTWLLPRREPGARCPRCGTELERKKVGQRSAWLCPRCQKRHAD